MFEHVVTAEESHKKSRFSKMKECKLSSVGFRRVRRTSKCRAFLSPLLLRSAWLSFASLQRMGSTRRATLHFLFLAVPRAFTIFCEERGRPEVSPAVNLLARKPLRPGALDVFAGRDPMGTGFVCRVDLFDGLRELGVSGTPPQQASNDRVLRLHIRHAAVSLIVLDKAVAYERTSHTKGRFPFKSRSTTARTMPHQKVTFPVPNPS